MFSCDWVKLKSVPPYLYVMGTLTGEICLGRLRQMRPHLNFANLTFTLIGV